MGISSSDICLFPFTRVNCKNSGHATPWFSDSIDEKEKHKARHVAERTGNDNDWSVYCRLKNQLKNTVHQTKGIITFSMLLAVF